MRASINILLAFLLALQPALLVTAEAGHVGSHQSAAMQDAPGCPDCQDCCEETASCDEACALSLCAAGGPVPITADPRIVEILGDSDELEDPLTCLSGGIPPVLLRPPIIV